MTEPQYRFNFSFLKISILLTLLLAILKVSNTIDITTIWVFMPVIVAVALLFFAIFLIGLSVIFIIALGLYNNEKNDEKQEDET